jgi:acyl-[acyl carrier protein]--UDP-N-acetylglucosamine O-acyltransferase
VLEKMKNEMADSAEIEEIINFIDTSERGII